MGQIAKFVGLGFLILLPLAGFALGVDQALMLGAPTNAFAHSEGKSGKKRHHHAHVHGQAKLSLVFDGATGEVDFDTPADSILGFEHKARTQAQKKLLSEATQKFRDQIASMIVFPSEMECSWVPSRVELKVGSGGHADWEAQYKVTCKVAPSKGTRVEVKLQEAFLGLSRVEVKYVLDSVQGSQALAKSGIVELQ